MKDKDAPIFNAVFNHPTNRFEKNEFCALLVEKFREIIPANEFKEAYISEDFNVFLKSYSVDIRDVDPEDNYICPLATLNLLEKKKDYYSKKRPKYSSLSYLIVYYSLTKLYKKSFTIEDAVNYNNSPLHLFNLDKNTFLQYLDEMKKHELIVVNKTAGLNTVYFTEHKLTLEEIFNEYFGG